MIDVLVAKKNCRTDLRKEPFENEKLARQEFVLKVFQFRLPSCDAIGSLLCLTTCHMPADGHSHYRCCSIIPYTSAPTPGGMISPIVFTILATTSLEVAIGDTNCNQVLGEGQP